MPVDTRSKRASSVSVLAPWMLTPVSPDGAISQGDRQHIAWTYSGILAGGAPPPPPPPPIHMVPVTIGMQGNAVLFSTGNILIGGLSIKGPVVPLVPMPVSIFVPRSDEEAMSIVPGLASVVSPVSIADVPPMVTIGRWSIPLCSQWLWDRWLWGKEHITTFWKRIRKAR